MSPADIKKRFVKVVMERLGVSEAEAQNEEARFEGDLGADSLDLVDLIIGTEDEFEIQIEDEDAEPLATVGLALRYLEGRSEELK